MRLAYRLLDRRHEHWILASMLLVLHAVLDAGLDSAFATALMSTHLGLFFLWQPIWQKDERLDPATAALIGLLVGTMLFALDWWLLFGWLVILIGLVAGRSFSTRQERYVYLVSLAVLIADLLLVCAPPLLLGQPLSPGLAQVVRLGLYLAPALIYAIPPITVPPREPFPVDFFRGITFALLTALLAAFSVLITLRLGLDYPLALVATLMVLALLLFFLSWMTTPGGAGIGLLAVWEKSVLNIGTPFEAWLGNIATLALTRETAEDFLEAAVDALLDIPWISAVEWRSADIAGIEGERTRHHLTVETESLAVTLYTERSFSSALLAHCRLLIHVLGHFYLAKRRENEEANEAHLRAIHETGARLTHDVKNLLQSLKTIAETLAAATGAEQERRALALLSKRLPDVVERLQLTLDRLQRPAPPSRQPMAADAWWQEASRRHADEDLQLSARFDAPGASLPRECFDSVLDNLLDNACAKRAAGQAARIDVELVADGAGVRLAVSDDGSAIAAELARSLLRRPVPSARGLGVGLYQSARQARAAGCTLELAENRAGRVCFVLAAPAQAPATQGS